MSATILRPQPMLGPVEAMRLRDNFEVVAHNAPVGGVIVDLTSVRELSGAGLAAVTNIVARARRIGIPIRVLLPEEGSSAGRIIEQADLWRFLRPGGVWNPLPPARTRPATLDVRPNGWPARWRRHRARHLGYGRDRTTAPA